MSLVALYTVSLVMLCGLLRSVKAAQQTLDTEEDNQIKKLVYI